MAGIDPPAVPRCWPGQTIAIFGGGPSLTQADCDRCHAAGLVAIAIKDAIRLAPWAQVLYSCDGDMTRWWQKFGPTLTAYPGLRYTLDPKAAPFATVLQNTGELGLEREPTGLRTGRNSGYQAINLAVHLGAARVLLLGFDMKASRKGLDHWFGNRAVVPYDTFQQCWPHIVAPLAAAGVTVLNCTPDSALRVFPHRPLVEALAEAA